MNWEEARAVEEYAGAWTGAIQAKLGITTGGTVAGRGLSAALAVRLDVRRIPAQGT